MGAAATPQPTKQSRTPTVGFPMIVGHKVEWPLFTSQLATYRLRANEMGPMVSDDIEVAGARFCLIFFPEGSPLRQKEGYCSFYFRVLCPLDIRFRLFVGGH